ncbi:cysteine desulfurase family protein [Lentisphaerota bacterium ZTH]|nr:cysteine desulfurase [Lentisphaerota bacterium]WET05247.1 cysteine desulfurase family protein [Lentisphaerota bacterium ZTH]
MKIYLDYNSTSPALPEVVDAMRPYFSDMYGNPSNLYSSGRKAASAIETARAQVAELIGVDPASRIIFTGSATEATNLALSGIMRKQSASRRKLLISSVEHAATRETALALQKAGFELGIIPVNRNGQLNKQNLFEQLDDSVGLVSLIWANNETGTVLDLEGISDAVHSCGALLHLDAVQAVGKISVDTGNIGADLLSISGHKLYGPKGIGALYTGDGIELEPLIYGGGQEYHLRSGTQNVAGIVGLGTAAVICRERLNAYAEFTASLRNSFETALKAGLKNFIINGDPESRLPNTLNVSFPGENAEKIAMQLDRAGIEAATGSACASRKGISGVLAAMGCSPVETNGAVRFSFGWDNTVEEVDFTVKTLLTIINKPAGCGFTKTIKV